MISKIHIKNFKCIESLTLDLSFEGTAPNGYKESEILSFLASTSKREDRVVPVMNIYGANASGKSNIIHSLFCFKKVLIGGIKDLPDIFSPNKLKDLGDNTFIQIDFFQKKKKFQYMLSYSQSSIEEEKLMVDNKELFSIEKKKGDFNGIAIQNFDNKNLKQRFKVSCLTPEQGGRQVNTFLSSLVSDLPGLNKNLNLALKFFEENLFVWRNNEIPAQFSIDQLAISNKKEDIEKAFQRIAEFIKKLDIDIERFQYEQVTDVLENYKVDEERYQIPYARNKLVHIDKGNNMIRINEIKSFHKNERGKDIAFGLDEESTGTRLAFGLIGAMLKILDTGGVFIIDELDRSLHTLLLQSLLRIFKDKEYNTNGAQIVSTLHNTDILDDDIYKKSEFSFVNKNLKSGTSIKRLSDFTEVRNELDFRKRYLNGLFSGIPYPYS